ncbi:MAG TPA: hypothetical protein VD838_04715, partial [Anaeromyxobacteraceae bacterium]|nr:hypothetical protein [Anaeromyxobacteraceae bacterium]
VDGQEVYYRDEEADREYARREATEHEAALRASYGQLQGELATRIARLPEVLQRRIARLRANAPTTFWRHEAHEVAVLEAALVIREHTTRALQKAVDEIKTSGLAGPEILNERSLGEVYRSFSRLPREVQQSFIPSIPDALSNKDVEFATALAHALAQGWDDQVVAYHAVGCAVDGSPCAECGCFDAETLARLAAESEAQGVEAAADGPCDGNCASCTRHEKEEAEMAFRAIADLAQRPDSPTWWNASFGQSA